MIREQKNKKEDKTVASIRYNFKVRLRQEQINNLFRNIRADVLNSAMQVEYNTNYVQNQLPMQIVPVLPQLPPQLWQNLMIQSFNNYILMLAQNQIQNQLPPPAPVQPQPQPIPNIESSQVQNIEPSSFEVAEPIYFEKQNVRVFKKLIGEGSYSKVWEGVDLRTNQKIAAKQIKKLQDAQYKCLKSLNSQHIIKIHNVIRHHRSFFIILQFCQRNLKEELDQCSYKFTNVLNYFEQIIKGMSVLQERNLIHRDLKFQNILISKEGVVKIADFGLAKNMGDQMEVESRRCGTPYTMAPEIYFSYDRLASYTTKCDIWSLGILLHEMLYQKHPFRSNKSEFKRGRRVKVDKKFGILDEIIDRCLVFQPDKRISWLELTSLFEFYAEKQKEGEENVFQINAESIVYQEKQQKNNEEEQFIKKKPQQKKAPINKRQLEYQRKFLNDYDAGSGIVNDSKEFQKQEGKMHKKQKQVQKEEEKINLLKKIEEKPLRINCQQISQSKKMEEKDKKLRESLKQYLEERKRVGKKNLFGKKVEERKDDKKVPQKKRPGKDLGELFSSFNKADFPSIPQEHEPIEHQTIKYVPRQTYFYQKTSSSQEKTRKVYEEVIVLIFVVIFLFLFFRFL